MAPYKKFLIFISLYFILIFNVHNAISPSFFLNLAYKVNNNEKDNSLFSSLSRNFSGTIDQMGSSNNNNNNNTLADGQGKQSK